ncbi:hypothetical protein E3E12_06290 [Formicincola oecophyllae]|uniref:Uncharacterized protein n=1 Tax=Formicincola oecophyllae TaxID=2558361 RepID=A0A4Y6UDG2_9PROT|nr:hypothetical protein [Formicincola oecophyllae]QDH14441.1 hypothetical protein E3E12_06290 [Formicincola oecophyllae]
MKAPDEGEGAPEGWTVRIIDQSGSSPDDDDTVEEVKGFHDLAHANAFARAYVRDSLERCRAPGNTAEEALRNWMAFGENAEVENAGDDGWKSSSELDDFAKEPATPMERDWRALDPRRLVDEREVDARSAFTGGPDDGQADEDDLDDDELIEIIRHNRPGSAGAGGQEGKEAQP